MASLEQVSDVDFDSFAVIGQEPEAFRKTAEDRARVEGMEPGDASSRP